MASVNVSCCINNWQNQVENLKILVNNNACEESFNNVPPKYGVRSCGCKQNVKYEQRTRSKSESCEFQSSVCCNYKYLLHSRTRTYSVSRSMHDKAVNVCMMPENMPELLLDGYQTKRSLKWPDISNGNISDPDGYQAEELNREESIPSDVQEYRNGKNGCIERVDESNHRECIIGIKRTREESPSFTNGSETSDSKDGIPYKIPPKIVTEADSCCGISNGSRINGFLNSNNGKFSNGSVSYCEAGGGLNGSYGRLVESTTEGLHNSKRYKTCDIDFVELPADNVNGLSSSQSRSVDDAHSELLPANEENDFQKDTDARIISSCGAISEINDGSNDSVEGTEDACQCYWNPLENAPGKTLNSNETALHSGLRLSLFPNVPPYVKFSTYDTKGEPFPIHIHKLLRWKLSTITPLVVRKIVINSGYRLLKKSTYWGGTWGKHTKSVGFKTLFDYQKMNHFPGTFQIGRKDRLWKSLQKLMAKFGRNKFDLMPTTYVLPQDKKLLKVVWKKAGGKEPWIIKPPASARGTGIKVVHKWCQIPENSPLVVQKYVSSPFLINDTKFDLRLYVLVTSVNPLRIYLYDNGLVRFASVKYSTELATLGDRYMHLTNYSINKLSSKYKQNEDAHACQGHKWTLKTLWSYMERELNVDVKAIWQRLIDLIIKTIISGEQSITGLSNANLVSRYNSYELFGIDVLFDEDLKPWLLEVNISPSLHSASPLDLAVKAPLVHDLMNIVGFQIPSSKKFTENELCKDLGDVPNHRLCYDNRLYTRLISHAERQKHHAFLGQSRQEYMTGILEDLTPDDVRHLVQYEDELTQLGSFQKIFPTRSTHEYLQYLENPRYYNLLFDAWETKYSENRREGVQVLYGKCEQGVHLRVPKIAVNTNNICEIHPRCPRYRLRNPTKPAEYPKRSPNTAPATFNQKKSSTKAAAVYAVNPRYRLHRSTVLPSKTYHLRSRKPIR